MTAIPEFTLTPETMPALRDWLRPLPWALTAWAVNEDGVVRVDLAPDHVMELSDKTRPPHPGRQHVLASIVLPDVRYDWQVLVGEDATEDWPLISAMQHMLSACCLGFNLGFDAHGGLLWAHGFRSPELLPDGMPPAERRERYAEAAQALVEETVARYAGGSYLWPVPEEMAESVEERS